MKKIIMLLTIFNTYLFSTLNIAVSILPQVEFVQAIGADKVNVSLMVKPGNSPHTYEPKPSQMVDIAKANLYFSMDVEFEHTWLDKFKSLNKTMKVIDLSKGIEKISMEKDNHNHHDHEKHEECSHNNGTKDPHLWTTPKNVEIIVKNIYNALVSADPKNTKFYTNNFEAFNARIKQTDEKITTILGSLTKSRTFMVFHPSWGYFAKAYNLKQISVEVGGKYPKPQALVSLIKRAKKEQVNAIFTQPEFSDSSAKIIAKELNIPVVKASPMAENWSKNLIFIAKIIANKE